MCRLESMPHPSEHSSPARPLTGEEAEEVAETLKALASPGRLRLLTELVERERTVAHLPGPAELPLTPPPPPLRLRRSLRLARARRDGRHVIYSLHDDHLRD